MKKHIKEFNRWISQSHEHKRWAQLWFGHYRIKRSLEFIEQYDADALWKKIEIATQKRQRNYRLIYTSSAVAASLLLLVAFSYYISNRPDERKTESTSTSGIEIPVETNGKKAILKLHSGEEIDLTNHARSIITGEEDMLLSISPDKSLVYTQNHHKEGGARQYNTLTIPRGGEYRLVLSDGTKVWLNAESSLHYPVFLSQTREVSLTGEAYFEVAPHNIPFVIHTSADSKVEVLGTKFNISAYSGNPACTTLAEGKVKVYNANATVILSPNQQAIAKKSGDITVATVNAKLFTSWAQGVFQFRKTRLSEIAAQLSRWYDVEISFIDEQLKHKLFTGVIYRRRELGFATETIERISKVKFKTKSDTLYVSYP